MEIIDSMKCKKRDARATLGSTLIPRVSDQTLEKVATIPQCKAKNERPSMRGM